MTSIIVAFLVSFIVATVTTPLVLKLARRRGLFDEPDGRKIHVRKVPRLGGIAIVLAFFAPLVALLFVEAGMREQLVASQRQLVGLFAGGLAIAALGLYDDLRRTNARQKFVVQIAVALMMWLFDYRIEVLSSPFGGELELGALALPATVLWFVGVINAVNLIDGLDGLAGGVGLIAVLTLMVLALLGDNPLAAFMCVCLAGGLLGFLIFNFNPARIFMGDTGSLFLGFTLAAFAITTSSKSATALAISVPLLVLALPLVDTAMAIVRRLKARRNVFTADQEHIHHRLLKAGFSHRGAVLVLYGITAPLAGLAILLHVTRQPLFIVAMLGLVVLVVVVLRHLTGLRRASPRPSESPVAASDGISKGG